MKPNNSEIFDTMEDYSIAEFGYGNCFILPNSDITKLMTLLLKAEQIEGSFYTLEQDIGTKDFSLKFRKTSRDFRTIPVPRIKYKEYKMAALLGLNQEEKEQDE